MAFYAGCDISFMVHVSNGSVYIQFVQKASMFPYQVSENSHFNCVLPFRGDLLKMLLQSSLGKKSLNTN